MPDQDKHYFFTVLLTDQYLQSALVVNNGQGIQIKEFSTIKTYLDRKDLLEQLDQSLQQLGTESQDVVETIFVFDHSWLEDGELSELKKPIVKEITEELNLDALGQISIPEALAEARLIGDENDSCLLLILKEDDFALVFLKHGKFLDFINVGRSASIVDDFTEALARAAKKLGPEVKYFPSKILITSLSLKTKELESLREQLNRVDWTTNPGFLQAPSIVALETDYMIKSASLSAGKVLTKDAFLSSLPKTDLLKNSSAESSANSTIKPTPKMEKQLLNQAEAGPDPEYAIEKNSASSFGIAFDRNYHAIENASLANPSQQATDANANKLLFDQASTHPTKPKNQQRFWLKHKKTLLLGFGAGLLGICMIFLFYVFFLTKITISLQPKQILLHKAVSITLDPNVTSSDFSKALLKVAVENKEISGQDVIETTGIGLVGEKAKGKVVIYNKTNESTKLKAGTSLSNNGIKFLLDADIEVPAKEEIADGAKYGKAETTVTAQDIGAEANFNKDTKFRVAEYFDDKFTASALDNFSGGSSREVRVVAQADLQQLSKNLSEKLLKEVNEELQQSAKEGIYLVPTGKNKILKSDYSAQVGEETESLTLNLTLAVEAVKYSSADLKELASVLLSMDLPDKYIFKDQPSLLTDKTQVASDSSQVKLSAEISTQAVAQISTDSLKSQLLGKKWQESKTFLETQAEIDQVEFIFQPPFLNKLLDKLPNDPKRILFTIHE